MKRSDDLLVAPGFLAALGVLLLNDFVLKPAFGNALTGKLSDFAGLFAFALFWMAVFPRRRAMVCAATAAAFVLWKSAAWQPLIDAWNAWIPLTVGRTVDASDLVALVAVGAAYRYAGAPRRQSMVSAARWAVIPMSLFAFAATSYRSLYGYEERYLFPVPRSAVMSGINSLGVSPWASMRRGDTLRLEIPADFCFGEITALVVIGGTGDTTEVAVSNIEHHCPRSRSDRVDLLRLFEQCFVARIDSTVAAWGPRPVRPSGPRVSCVQKEDRGRGRPR